MKARHLKLACLGHIDHGKSSLVGRLFYDTGNISHRQMRRIKTIANELGKDGCEYAFVMDQFRKERELGVTMSIAYKKLLIGHLSITFADAPGHRDFIKSMLTGVAVSDAAILVVAADEGIQSQTRSHLYLAKLFGVERLIIFINKFDLLNYSQKYFKGLTDDIRALLRKTGFYSVQIPIIPGSALYGENITEKSRRMKWYEGKCVLTAIKNLLPKENTGFFPFRFPVQGRIKIGKSEMLMGRIVSGCLKVGDEIVIQSKGIKSVVKKIFIHNQKVNMAYPNDNVFLLLGRDISMIKRGDIISHIKQATAVTKFFLAQIILLDYFSIKPGFKARLELQTESAPVIIRRFRKVIDIQTGEEIKCNPKFIRMGEAGLVEIVSKRPLSIETQRDMPCLSNFALIKNGKCIIMGVCIEIKRD